MFWLQAAKSAVSLGKDAQFKLQDSRFITAARSVGEIVMVLGIIGLDFEKAECTIKRDDNNLIYTCAKGTFMLFCKQLNDKSAGQIDMDIIVTQRFFDPVDKYTYDQNNTNLSTLKKVDEFLTGKLYSARIAVTNSSDSAAQLELVWEIPQGSIPVTSLEST